MAKVVLFRDHTRKEYLLDTPLTSNINLDEVKSSLGIPDFVNYDRNFTMESALVTIYAAVNAHRLRHLYPNVVQKNFSSSAIPALLFGGVAIRMHSPSSNDSENPFFRNPNDLDLIVPKKRGSELVSVLLSLDKIFGTRYYHFESDSDKNFNAMRAGKRYRIRTVAKITEEGTPLPGVLDILTDRVDLRHGVDVTDDFKTFSESNYTITPSNILLTKCQFIFDMPRSVMPQISEAALEYRVLNYPHLKSNAIVFGMEEKDIRDVCALIADVPIGETPRSISTTRIKNVLDHDKKFALTFRLNIQNIIEKAEILDALDVGRSTASRIIEGLQEILKVVPDPDKKWNSPWWDIDVETPQIFGKS